MKKHYDTMDSIVCPGCGTILYPDIEDPYLGEDIECPECLVSFHYRAVTQYEISWCTNSGQIVPRPQQ